MNDYLQPGPVPDDLPEDWWTRGPVSRNPFDPFEMADYLDMDGGRLAVAFAHLDPMVKMDVIRDMTHAQRKGEAVRARELYDEKVAARALQKDIESDADRLRAEERRQRYGLSDPWAPVDLKEAFAADPIKPTVGEFTRKDGVTPGGVFYPGKVNTVHGPSESGKSMLTLAVAAQEIRAGRGVIMIDFEDDSESVVGRLRDVFGLTEDEILTHFTYFNSNASFTDSAYDRIRSVPNASYCIIDAATESMSASGLDGRNENDVATWYGEFPRRIAQLGIAVVVIDHTPQENSTRAIGSQHKKSAIDGVAYAVEAIHRFTRGRRGLLRIRVAKDRPGAIRAMAQEPKDEKITQEWRGDLVIDGSRGYETPWVELRDAAPEDARDGAAPAPEPGTPPASLPEVTENQYAHLSALSFYEREGVSPSGLASKMTTDAAERGEEGKRFDRQNVRNVLIALQKLGLAGHLEGNPKGWGITPMGVSVIAQRIANGEKWGAPKPRRREVSQEVSQGQAKLVSETSET